MQIVESLHWQNVVLELVLLAVIGCTVRAAFSDFPPIRNTILFIFIDYCFFLILCAVLYALHHTPLVLIGWCVGSVLWRNVYARSRSLQRVVLRYTPFAFSSTVLQHTPFALIDLCVRSAIRRIPDACCRNVKRIVNCVSDACPESVKRTVISYVSDACPRGVKRIVNYVSDACPECVKRIVNYVYTACKNLMHKLHDPAQPPSSRSAQQHHDSPSPSEAISQQSAPSSGSTPVPSSGSTPVPSSGSTPVPASGSTPVPASESVTVAGSQQSAPSSGSTPATAVGSQQSSSSHSTPALDRTPSTHYSPTSDSGISPGYVPRPTHPQLARPPFTLYSQGWDTPRKSNDVVSQLSPGHPPVTRPQTTTRPTSLTRKEPIWSSLHRPHNFYRKKIGKPQKPKSTSQPATDTTVSRPSPGHRTSTSSSSYTTPPSIYYAPIRESDTLLGYVIKNTSTIGAASPAKEGLITWSSWPTPSILSRVKYEEPRKSISNKPKRASHRDRHVMFEDSVPPDSSFEINLPPGIPYYGSTTSRHYEPVVLDDLVRPETSLEIPYCGSTTSRHYEPVVLDDLVQPETSLEINQLLGIRNYGNTCFFNASIQCLTWSGGFLEVFERIPRDYNGLIHGLVTTMRQIQDRNVERVNARPLLILLSYIIPHLVTVEHQRQQDASELLMFILTAVHEQYVANQQQSVEYMRNREEILERLEVEFQHLILQTIQVKTNNIPTYRDAIIRLLQAQRHRDTIDNSPVYDLCKGQRVTVTECQNCQKLSFNAAVYTLLFLPLPDQVDDRIIPLTDTFNALDRVENLTRQCTCRRDPCRHRQWAVLSDPLPQKLILGLGRFGSNEAPGRDRKKFNRVAFPLADLDLTPFRLETTLAEPGAHRPAPLYDLSAICVHVGETMTSGHYIAYCKQSPSEHWYLFDDLAVRRVNIRDIIVSNNILCNAYILFYSKRV